VARAAAQGPLAPPSPETEPEDAAKEELPAHRWYEEEPSEEEPAEQGWHEEESSVLEPERPWGPPAYPADFSGRQPDPFEELAKLAREYAAARVVPRRHTDHPLDKPADTYSYGPTPAETAPTFAEPGPTPGEPGPSAASAGLAQGHEEQVPWPVGERRSAARQARKPLPAALQAAVASGAAGPELDTVLSPRPSKQQPGTTERVQNSAAVADGKRPGVLRRYAAALAIVVLFVAAGAAAVGIAALHHHTTRHAPTPAQDRAAASRAVLGVSDFPAGWTATKITNGSTVTAYYGVGSVLVTPSIVQPWVAAHPGCATTLGAVSTAMTPSAGNPVALASSRATATNPSGGSWQIADSVAFHVTAAQVASEVASMRTLLAHSTARGCISHFFDSALLAEMPARSRVVATVSQLSVLSLPGNPSLWAMSMSGTATVRHVAVPVYFDFASFAAGRAEVSFAAASRSVPLPGSLQQRWLATLAMRAEHLTS